MYHVINRGNYRRDLFVSPGEAKAFLETELINKQRPDPFSAPSGTAVSPVRYAYGTWSAIDRTASGAWAVITTRPDDTQQIQRYENGLLVSTTRKPKSSDFDPLSEDLVTDYPEVTQTTYIYDGHNRVQTQADARTGAVAYTYTDRDEVLSITANNDTETTAYAYDALGNQLTITRPDNSVTTNEYHLRNNQLKKTSGSQTSPVEYAYDLHGRMKTMTTWQNATSSTGAAITTWNYEQAEPKGSGRCLLIFS